MKNNATVTKIRKALRKEVDVTYRDGSRAFFKEPIYNYGVRTPVARRIARQYYQEVADFSKKELFAVAETLMKTNTYEEVLIALAWMDCRQKEFVAEDFKTFERWASRYITNWAMCDDFCGHALGRLLYAHPQLVKKTAKWTRSKNRWLKRAAVVSLIYSVRRKKQLQAIFRYSDALLTDPDDLVQKGYGWALKEASNAYPKEVLDFVMKRKSRMPRNALRYAIEKMPQTLKNKAMRV